MSAHTTGLTPEQRRDADAVLRQASVAYLALVEETPGDRGGSPYVVPVNFAYEGSAVPSAGDAPRDPAARLLFHTGAGRKTRALARNPKVCLAVTTDTAFATGPTPCEDGFTYRSVLVWGQAARLDDQKEREQALRTIVAKYDPEAAAGALDPRHLAKTMIFAVTVDTVGYKARP